MGIRFLGVKFGQEFKNAIKILIAPQESAQKHDLLVPGTPEAPESVSRGEIRPGVQKCYQNNDNSTGKRPKTRFTSSRGLRSMGILFLGGKFGQEFKNAIRIMITPRESVQKHDLLVLAVSEAWEYGF